MMQPVVCSSCGAQHSAGVRFCTNCGAPLPPPPPPPQQQQPPPAQPQPSVHEEVKSTEQTQIIETQVAPQQYVWLGAASVIFKILGWVVLVGGILGSIALAVIVAQGGLPKLTSLLDRAVAIVSLDGVANIGVIVLIFCGIILSLVWGLGFLAFSEICSAVNVIDSNTRSQE